MFLEENSLIMTAFIAGFFAALLFAALVIIWITYHMFFKERHKSERFQYNISDLRRKNIEIAQEIENEKCSEVKSSGLAAGILILPSRRRQRDSDVYDQRPDYPESTWNMEDGSKEFIQIFHETAADVINEVNSEVSVDYTSESQYQSDV